MKKIQNGFITPLIITITALLIIGASTYLYLNKKPINSSPVACTMEAKQCPGGSYVGRTGPNCEFTPCPKGETSERQMEFGKSITMLINDKIIFPDTLSLTLKEINDSRCKPGLQCFWQGELSALFDANIKGSLEEIRLGTVNNKKVILKGYTFSLESATENSMTIGVSVNSMSKSTSGINGYIHMGPICPVERIPPDPNCADKPFVNAKVDIVINSSGALIKTVTSDTNGNFSVNLPVNTYTIKVSNANSILPRCEGKESIVTTNNFTNLDISCDSGIR